MNESKFYRSRDIKTIVYLIILMVFAQFSHAIQQEKSDSIHNDVKEVIFKKDTEIKLEKGWMFYWNDFIEPSKFKSDQKYLDVSINSWTEYEIANGENFPSFGYATYRLLVSLPKAKQNLSLYIPPIYSAAKIWVNKKLMHEIGTVSKSQKGAFHRRFAKIIPLDTNETELEIVIHVSNYYHNKGGLVEPPIIATTEYLLAKSKNQTISDMIFIGSLSFIGILFLLFFLFYWNKDIAVLYFAIFCLSWSYRALSDAYAPFAIILPNISWTLLARIEYISLFLGAASGCLFFGKIFSDYTHKAFIKLIKFGFLVSFIAVLFLPSQIFTKMLVPFVYFMSICLLYMIFVIIRTSIISKHKSILALLTIVLGLIVFCIHVFVFFDNDQGLMYVNLGYVLVFLLLSMLLMMRFSSSFQDLERARSLEIQQRKEISLQSEELLNMNSKLKENLENLEKTNSELDNFTHIIAHDLKSPLVSMNALISFIQDDLNETVNKETQNHLSLLKERGLKMGAMIDGLLDYSQIVKGNKTKEIFNLNDLLNDIIVLVDTKKECIFELPKGKNEIYANKIELEHVFHNLIQNSIKHNDKEQIVLKISFSKSEGYYYFTVEDNGSGINPLYHEKIFKLFTKINTNEEVKSTGIGLSIVKKIVAENQGSITVESNEGLGTKIKFTFKIDQANLN